MQCMPLHAFVVDLLMLVNAIKLQLSCVQYVCNRSYCSPVSSRAPRRAVGSSQRVGRLIARSVDAPGPKAVRQRQFFAFIFSYQDGLSWHFRTLKTRKRRFQTICSHRSLVRREQTMNSCYNDKFCPEKWGGSGRPSRPASDGPATYTQMHAY